MSDTARLRQELDYYRRQLDELSGENLRLDYVASSLRHEVVQKRAGFALLSELQQKIGAHQRISSIFELVVPAINSTLGMERTVVLTPTAQEHVYRPSHWLGYRADEGARLAEVSLELPEEFSSGGATMIVNKAAVSTPLIETLRAALQLPYFVLVPVAGDRSPIGLLVSGRLKENKPYYPALDRGDLEAFQAITGLISGSVRTMRVALLEETDRLKSEFFANISHEFRTPITLSLGPIEQMLSGRFGSVSSEARDRLIMVQRNQERLLNLVNQVLDLAKVEAGAARLKATLTRNVNRAIERRLSQFQVIAEERGLDLVLRLDPAAEQADLYLDREMFDKVLNNLVSNAVKFTRQGSINVSTRIRDGNFWLEVADTGIGIKTDQLPHIFDRFRQADGSESREYAGTGIGLALVKEIATLHGGDVTVLSEYGRGSTFRVCVPLGRKHLDAASVLEGTDAPDASPAPAMAVVQEGRADQVGVQRLNRDAEAGFDAERPTVLYAEDNADLQRHVRSVLNIDANVFVAADGHEALRLARHYRPDVIVTDQMMPRMSGRDLLKALRADEALRDTPVLFLTARAGTEARVESLESGADDYVTKPFQEAELRARVRNLIRARTQARQITDLNRRLESRVQDQMAELFRAGQLMRFLPRAVAENVMQGPTLEEPLQRRKITVLCAAPEGLPALMEALEPEELSTVVNELLRELIAIAMEQGGTVTQPDADSMKVLFGAPVAMDVTAQADAAIRTALRMRDVLPRLRTVWRRRGIADSVGIRIGLNTGFCTVGTFGSEHLRSYTAIGAPVVAASRLQSAAARDEVLCGLPTYVLLEPRIRGTSRGALLLQGLAHPLEVFAVDALDETGRAVPASEPAAASSSARLAGAMIGHYRIVAPLGAGGMGEVYRARDTRLERDVALKLLPPHLASDVGALKRFEREAKAVASLNHPNIVVIYSFEESSGKPFITMEVVDGSSLDAAIPRDGMSIAALLDVAIPLVDALSAAHASGLTHRDLKPSNIMVAPDRRVKVLDFGLAERHRHRVPDSLLTRTTDFTHDATIWGTLSYTAPEVLQGHEADSRSDVFSLGVLLYQMATGGCPFTGSTSSEVLAAILRDDPEPIVTDRADLPASFSRIVRRCLEKDPARRYSDTRDLLRELRMVQNSAPTSSSPHIAL